VARCAQGRAGARLVPSIGARWGSWLAKCDVELAGHPLREQFVMVPMQRRVLASDSGPPALAGWSVAMDRFVVVLDFANDKLALVPR
jgi:hypothetical protein